MILGHYLRLLPRAPELVAVLLTKYIQNSTLILKRIFLDPRQRSSAGTLYPLPGSLKSLLSGSIGRGQDPYIHNCVCHCLSTQIRKTKETVISSCTTTFLLTTEEGKVSIISYLRGLVNALLLIPLSQQVIFMEITDRMKNNY